MASRPGRKAPASAANKQSQYRRSLQTTYIQPLPRFTLPYILESSPEIRDRIFALAHESLQTLLNLRLVNKAFAGYTCAYVFQEVHLVFKPDFWNRKNMEALKRVGTHVKRVIFNLKHNQDGAVGQGPGNLPNTRIPYAVGRTYYMELEDRDDQPEGRSLMWVERDHLNPVPEIIEFRTKGGTNKDDDGGRQERRSEKVNIPISKTGGPLDTSNYGPLFLTASSSMPFTEFFLCTPKVTSLVIQMPGNDLNWEYSSLDIALESLRLGAVAAGIKIQELACTPIHILGLETLSIATRRTDVQPASFGLLGCGGLRRLELEVNARMMGGGTVEDRDMHIYGRIMRSFLLALGGLGRNGIETLKFQWVGGGCGMPKRPLDCPFLVSNTIDRHPNDASNNEGENMAICAALTFPRLTRLYIRNVSTTASGLHNFLWDRAKKCDFVSNRLVLLKDFEDHRYAMRGFEPLWDDFTTENKSDRIFSGDYQRSKNAAMVNFLTMKGVPGGGVREP